MTEWGNLIVAGIRVVAFPDSGRRPRSSQSRYFKAKIGGHGTSWRPDPSRSLE